MITDHALAKNFNVRQLGAPHLEIALVSASPPVLTINDWLTRDLPQPDPIMGEWLTTTSRAMLIAPTGLGKTNFSLQLAMNTAAGTGFLHWEGRRKCRTLYIDGEMSRRLLKQRIADAAWRLGDRPEGFHALSHEDIEGFAPLNTPLGQAYIDQIIERIGGVDLIVFDSIMCLLLGDMRDGESWAQVMPWVRKLTKERIGQIWVHHTGHDTTRGYGDKTKEWQLDTVLHLEAVENPTADISFALEFRKARERTPHNRADFERIKVTLLQDAWTCDLKVGKRAGRVSPTAKKFREALVNALASDGATRRNDRPAASLELWKRECVRQGLIDPQAKRESARSLFSKYRRELIAANLVACDDEIAWLK